ncbi:MAG: P-II family nitrogen regulator [Acidobacteriota bacterium]
MKEIKAIIQPFMLEKVLEALDAMEGLPGLTVSEVRGWGRSRAANAKNTSEIAGHAFAPKTKIEIVVGDELADKVIDVIVGSARTGHVGDGKVFVQEIVDAVRISTGARGDQAL